MNKKVLVTGGTGFLGSYLVRQLVKKGYQVRILKRTTSSLTLLEEVKNQVEWMDGDILDVISLEDAMEGIDQVYHCAAVVSFDPKRVDEMMQINVEGTANVVNAALYEGIEKMVYVSSIAAIGRNKNVQRISEKSKWERSKENSNYAISKFLAEQEVWRGMAEGLDMAIVNPAVIIGSGYWDQTTVRLFKQVWDGLKFYPIGSTGFVDVRDVARMCIQLMESEILHERIIANGENCSYRHFFSTIATQLGKKVPSIQVTPLLQEIAWRVEWLRSKITGSSPLVTKESARQSARTYIYENDKSLQLLNFQYTPLTQTIEETSQQLKAAASKNFAPMYLPFEN